MAMQRDRCPATQGFNQGPIKGDSTFFPHRGNRRTAAPVFSPAVRSWRAIAVVVGSSCLDGQWSCVEPATRMPTRAQWPKIGYGNPYTICYDAHTLNQRRSFLDNSTHAPVDRTIPRDSTCATAVRSWHRSASTCRRCAKPRGEFCASTANVCHWLRQCNVATTPPTSVSAKRPPRARK